MILSFEIKLYHMTKGLPGKDVLRISLGDQIRQDIAMAVARQKDLAVGGDLSRKHFFVSAHTNVNYIIL